MSAGNARVEKGLRNGAYGLIFYVVTLVLGFISNRVFIHRLGAELLGLTNTITSLVESLNIAELGIATALTTLLYAPLAGGERQTVAELVALQGWIYRRVAAVFFGGACVAMLFFPRIFAGEDVPLVYAYAVCAVTVVASLCTYLINYPMVVLEANQESHAVTWAYRLPAVFRLALQIVAIEYTDHGYELWIVLQLLGTVASTLLLRRAVKRLHPYLDARVPGGRELMRKYPEVKRRMGQVFVHRLASVAMTRVSPLIVFSFSSLALVAAYGNYMLIFYGLTQLFGAVAGGIQGGVGNVVAEGDKRGVMRAFNMVFAVDCAMAAVSTYGFYVFADAFVECWVGTEMVIGGAPVALIAMMVYIAVSRSAVGQFTTAYGFFGDVWAAGAETALNLGLSVVFGSLWGLSGVLLGVVSSLVAIVLIWKPIYLFGIKLGGSPWPYWLTYARNAVLALGVGYALNLLCGDVPAGGEAGFAATVWRMAWQTGLYAAVMVGTMLCVSRGMRDAARSLLSTMASRRRRA